MPASELVKICLKLSKYKKENKELLSYLLFESNYEPDYIANIKSEMDQMFTDTKTGNLYFFKKHIRKILRFTNKFIRYSGQKQTEVELRMYFCTKLNQCGVSLQSNVSLTKILEGQIVKINKAINSLHEDLQHDYHKEISSILPSGPG